MTEMYENTKKWRHNTKIRCIEILGGECRICGYKKCIQALEFHHADPSIKESEISRLIISGNIDMLLLEVKKCICLCSNCHKEVHAGIVDCPNISINESMLDEEVERRKPVVKICIECGRRTTQNGGRCVSCFNISRRKFNPSKEELEKLLVDNNFVQIGKTFGVSYTVVIRRCKMFGIYKRKKRAASLVV